jgi:hypothetical protein
MFTGRADYFRHVYKVDSELKTYSVYVEVKELTKKNLLTSILRIEKFNGKSNATGINEYLRLRTSTSWANSEKVTGLRKTGIPNLYEGNRMKEGKKSLILFYFSEDRKTLTIDVFNSFYPFNSNMLKAVVALHKLTY